jgi:hypothetical protein
MKIMLIANNPEQYQYDVAETDMLETIVADVQAKLSALCLDENITSEIAKVVSAVNLPALTLPKFNGDFMQWMQ